MKRRLRCFLKGHAWRKAIFPPGLEGCARCPRRRGGIPDVEAEGPTLERWRVHSPARPASKAIMP